MDEERPPDGSGQPGSGTVVSIAALTSPGLGFVVPFLGPWLSMLAVVLAARRGWRLWPAQRHRWLPLAVIAALWGPGLLALAFLISFGDRLGSPETSEGLQRVGFLVETVAMTYWLFLPLAAPEDIVTPGVAACAVLAAGAAASASLRTPWPWLLGAAAAPLTYAAVVLFLDIRFMA
jgi:hypothetical protein